MNPSGHAVRQERAFITAVSLHPILTLRGVHNPFQDALTALETDAFHRHELGMVLDDPQAELGGFKEQDITRSERQVRKL